jgi:phospholipase C
MALAAFAAGPAAHATGDITKVKHIIIVMQENHSFDNYFGVLAYAPHGPYHPPKNGGACAKGDHRCVDGLTCSPGPSGGLVCFNSNPDDDGSRPVAFHDPSRCVVPDLDHGWLATHKELNFADPTAALSSPLNDGFVRVNDATEQVDNGVESPTEDETIGYYDQTDLPFYYGLAQTFAISDRQFASVVGPTAPNRFYLMAATSFGHVTTDDIFPPPGGYKPVTGTIFDLLDRAGVTWGDYFEDLPQTAIFRPPVGSNPLPPNALPLQYFYLALSNTPGVPPLPQVVFIDPNFGTSGTAAEDDEHPPTDIQRGQVHVSQVLNAIRNSPYWKDSVVFVTYDEHGGFYDHVAPPAARQGSLRAPDKIAPGQCEDLSNPPTSEQPGGGAECSANPISTTDTSLKDAIALCAALAADPTGPYPASCPSFDQLGVRVPMIAVSPFSKPHYVSHVARDHTALLAFIERRFLQPVSGPHQHLTARDKTADSLEGLFNFDTAPSMNAVLGTASPPASDCTPTQTAGGGVP